MKSTWIALGIWVVPWLIGPASAELEALCQSLVRTPSENPPGDTTALAAKVEAFLATLPGMQVRRVVAKDKAVNLIGRLPFGRPGRRLLMNGHLDTFLANYDTNGAATDCYKHSQKGMPNSPCIV